MKPFFLCFVLFVGLLRSSYGQIPITAGTYFPPNTPLTEDGVPVLNRKYSRNDAVHYPGPQTLDHYSSFVNDPYVSTEDLGSIISSRPRPQQRPQQRQRPELRSGSESYTGDRIRWSDPFQPSSSSYSRTTSSYTQSPQEQDGRYRSNSNTYTYTSRNIPYYGNGNGEWEVADKGDNHITYRRRTSSTRQWQSSPTVQRFDTQRGQVSARVVDMRTNDRDDDYSRRRGGDTRRTNTDTYNYRPARPETRSLDYNPSIFPTNTRSATGNTNIDAYWQQRRQGSGSSSSSSSWPTTSSGSSYSGSGYSGGNNYYDRRQDSYNYNAQYRPAPRFEPNYPILNDRETAAKAGVPNTVVITV